MELLERYLQEVRRYLPRDEQDDLIAEISDDLQTQIEARESELGRALTSDEEVALIKAYGHPRVVGARYQPQRYLIGPELFPFWWYTVKIVLICVLALELVGITIAALVSTTPFSDFAQGVAVMWSSIFWVFGVVTVAFAVIERYGASQTVLSRAGVDRWNPRILPNVPSDEVSRPRSLWEAFVNIAALLWLLDFPYVRHSLGFMVLGPGVNYLAPLALAPAWHPFFVTFFIASLIIVAMEFAVLVHPNWARLRAATLVLANALYVVGACLILPVRNYVVLIGHSSDYASALPYINEAIFYTLIAFAVICAGTAALNARAFLRKPDRPNLNMAQA